MYIITALNAMQSSSLAGSVTMWFGICKNNYQLHSNYHLLWFFSQGSKPICLGQRSSKTDFLFTPNSIFHIVSHLSDHLDQASHLKIVELVSSFTCIALLKFCLKPYKIRFTPYLTTQINQKRRKKITKVTHSRGAGGPREA